MPDPDLSYLREPPDSATRVPPPGDREADLPLREMGWKNFERLCLAYGETTGDFVDTSFYGTEGQSQQGIDLVLRCANSRHVTIQCRQVQKMTAASLKKA